MIRFKCSDCDRPFKVADEHAGKTIRCPACKSAIKVPAEEPEDEPAPLPRKPSRAVLSDDAGIAPRRKARPPVPDEDEDEAPRRRRRDEEDDEDDRPRKKKKKPKAETTDSKLFMALAIGLSVLYVVLGGLAFFSKGGAIVMLVVGVVPVCLGTWWVSSIAKEESYLEYLGCLYVPFYDTYYSFSRWSQTWAACLMCWIGRVFAVTAVILLIFHLLHEKGGGGGGGGGGGPRFDTPSSPAEADARCVELLKSPDAAEAWAWLAAPNRRVQGVTVGRLPLRPAVEGLYKQGAVRVTFAEMALDEDGDDPMHLVVELPAEKEKRQAVLIFVNGQLLEPDARQSDRGQKYLLVETN